MSFHSPLLLDTIPNLDFLPKHWRNVRSWCANVSLFLPWKLKYSFEPSSQHTSAICHFSDKYIRFPLLIVTHFKFPLTRLCISLDSLNLFLTGGICQKFSPFTPLDTSSARQTQVSWAASTVDLDFSVSRSLDPMATDAWVVPSY